MNINTGWTESIKHINVPESASRNFGVDSAVAVTLAAHPDLIRKELKIPDDLSIIIGIALGRRTPDILRTSIEPLGGLSRRRLRSRGFNEARRRASIDRSNARSLGG